MAGPAYFDAFRRITVQPDNVTVTADAVNDQLTLTAGTGISLVANPNDDTITIVNSGPGAPTLDQVLSFGAVSNQIATFGGLIVNGNISTSGTLAADLIGSVFSDNSTRIINGADGTVTTQTAYLGRIKVNNRQITLTDPLDDSFIAIKGGSNLGGVGISNNLIVGGSISRVDALGQPITLSVKSTTTNTPSNPSTPSEWMEITVNGNTRYIPLYT